jgi:hypothetical protein
VFSTTPDQPPCSSRSTRCDIPRRLIDRQVIQTDDHSALLEVKTDRAEPIHHDVDLTLALIAKVRIEALVSNQTAAVEVVVGAVDERAARASNGGLAAISTLRSGPQKGLGHVTRSCCSFSRDGSLRERSRRAHPPNERFFVLFASYPGRVATVAGRFHPKWWETR